MPREPAGVLRCPGLSVPLFSTFRGDCISLPRGLDFDAMEVGVLAFSFLTHLLLPVSVLEET